MDVGSWSFYLLMCGFNVLGFIVDFGFGEFRIRFFVVGGI